jgi:hypothetical protein
VKSRQAGQSRQPGTACRQCRRAGRKSRAGRQARRQAGRQARQLRQAGRKESFAGRQAGHGRKTCIGRKRRKKWHAGRYAGIQGRSGRLACRHSGQSSSWNLLRLPRLTRLPSLSYLHV